MLGGTALKARGVMPAIARQRLTAFSNSSRSMSSLRPQVGRLNRSPLAGGLSTRPTSFIPKASSVRFNSTSTPTPADNSGIPEMPFDLSKIPEKIGYLKDLGLDYGWGPSAMMEFFIEHFHIWGGLPWWGSIIGTGLLVRFALLHPMLRAADTSTKVNNIKHLSAPIRTKMLTASKESKMQDVAQAKAELKELHAQHGIQSWRAFVPMLQIPLGYGCYRTVQGMANLPVPGLATETVGWIQDLTVADPLYILPALSSYLLFRSLKKGGESGANQLTSSVIMRYILYGMPVLSFVITAFFPSALQLYFLATGVFGYTQATLLASPSFRRFAKIAMPEAPPVDAIGPGGTSEQSKAIRMLTDALEAERAKMVQDPKVNEANISFIDRYINKFQETKDASKRDLQEKMDEMRGKAPSKNADGSPAAPPRLSEKDVKLATSYERRRKEEEEWKRNERNHARREAHLKALEAEKEKARSSFKKASNKTKQR